MPFRTSELVKCIQDNGGILTVDARNRVIRPFPFGREIPIDEVIPLEDQLSMMSLFKVRKGDRELLCIAIGESAYQGDEYLAKCIPLTQEIKTRYNI